MCGCMARPVKRTGNLLVQVEEVPADLTTVYIAREITSSKRFRISIDNCIGIRLTF